MAARNWQGVGTWKALNGGRWVFVPAFPGPALDDFTSLEVDVAAGIGGGVGIDATTYGVKADNVTDDRAAVQSAIDAAVHTGYAGLAGNDVPATVVQLPWGRPKISSALNLHSNMVLRGHGPANTLLRYTGTTGQALQLATGAEVQVEVRDLSIIVDAATAWGMYFDQTGGASILGDTRHVIENVVIIGGGVGIFMRGGTEYRLRNVGLYRQTPPTTFAALHLSGTDSMLSDVTVAAGQAGAAGGSIRAETSNTRFVDVKVFGQTAQYPALWVIGQRNQIIGFEAQDCQGVGAYDSQGLNVWEGVVIDSCFGGGSGQSGFIADGGSGGSVVRGLFGVNRAGGSYTMASLLKVSGTGHDIEGTAVGLTSVLQATGTAGSRIRVNGMGGTASVAYAASVTPDPLVATVYQIGTLTGAITIANPAPSMSNIPWGTELEFILTQDGTGGRVVTFGNAYKTSAAVSTTLSTTTVIRFRYDGTFWRELSRAVT